jgi:hypothetical protein
LKQHYFELMKNAALASQYKFKKAQSRNQ